MAHSTTFAVLNALPRVQKQFWGIEQLARKELEKIVERGNQDMFCWAKSKNRTELAKYFISFRYAGDRSKNGGLNRHGRLFHYLPVDTDVTEGYGAWQSNSIRKWRFVMRGFRHYFRLILKWQADGRRREALTAVCALFHFLQDQTAFFHSLEGEEGAGPWILDELIDVPAGVIENPVMILHEYVPVISLKNYKPVLLGASLEETCFHLYQRYRKVKHQNRKRIVPMIQAHYRGNASGERMIRQRIGRATAELTFDAIYTLYCLATKRFPVNQVSALQAVALDDLIPINYPRHAGPPYRFTTLVKNAALGADRLRVPLQLTIKTGGRLKQASFSKGIAVGCHCKSIVSYPVPRGVFRRLVGQAGLHADLYGPGSLNLTIYLNRRLMLRANLNRTHPSIHLNLDIISGGMLTFDIQQGTPYSFPGTPAEHLMLAELRFLKTGEGASAE